MSRIPELQEPIRAATETAASHGVITDRCEILQDGHTLVLRLTADLVARVVTDREGPREGGDWFSRESSIACFLAENDAPVIPMHPAIPPGPHEHLGYTMNFWQFVKEIEEEPHPADTGRTLFQCHLILRGFPEPLPELGILRETLDLLAKPLPGNLLSPSRIRLLAERLGASLSILRRFPMQPLHGDAHAGNLMNTTRGLLWTDWEDTFLGPVEWDLASIIWNARYLDDDLPTADAVLAAYRDAGGSIDDTAMHHSFIARAAVMCAWYPHLYPNPSPERREKLQARLDWLRSTDSR